MHDSSHPDPVGRAPIGRWHVGDVVVINDEAVTVLDVQRVRSTDPLAGHYLIDGGPGPLRDSFGEPPIGGHIARVRTPDGNIRELGAGTEAVAGRGAVSELHPFEVLRWGQHPPGCEQPQDAHPSLSMDDTDPTIDI